ncbi:MAG: LysM peptidoglycan-binding domain-containing protein [Nitrospirae bacterium]|nr:LysM peptidoglycan-binding domain-containing protein [Nitrospirota bacterium]
MMTEKTGIVKILFVCTVYLFLTGAAPAEASVNYTVRKGDNPYTIAKKFRVSVRELQDTNHLDPMKMKPGMKIVIPGHNDSPIKKTKASVHKKDEQTAKKTKKTDTHASSDQKPAGPAKDTLYHTVKKGDTLASVSKKYTIPIDEIRELNNLKSSKLKNGQRLLVKRIGPRSYTVKKGDNIRKIAKRFNVDADDLMELNEMGTPEIRVGQKLFLEERVDAESAGAYQEIFANTRNLEDELKKVSESEEFAKKESPDKLITFAKKLVNIPYKFGGNSILGIDCSAYVKKVYGLLGVQLPRTAREQFHEGEAIDRDELSIGDLVFFRTYASFPSHVGIYLGNNLFIHASSKGKKVTIDSLETPYYLKRFIGGKRLLTQGDQEKDPNS